jgi:hypothetical protein
MGRRINANPHPAQNIEQLTRQVQQAWRDIPQDDIRRLFDSMPRRIQECCAANGGHTSY